MPLPILSFQQTVDAQATAMQASTPIPLDFTTGAILLALVESNAGNTLWLQSVAEQVLATTRLTTSVNNDVDTFVEQFGLTRNPATPASGYVTLSRFTSNLQATISIGATVSAISNGISYIVGIDTTNPYYSPSLSAYILPIGVSETNVPVTATTAGEIGNLVANQITTISSIIFNIDTVTNHDAFVNGRDAESDDALKTRFVLFINSLSKATKSALGNAISNVSGVDRYELIENSDLLSSFHPGFFYALIDDGTGNASTELLETVSAQLDVTRAFTVAFASYAPTQYPMSFSANVYTDKSIPDNTVKAAVIESLQNYVSRQGFQSLFAWSEVPRIIYETNLTLSGLPMSPITNVSNWLVNGSTNDIQLTGRKIPVNGTFTIVMNA